VLLGVFVTALYSFRMFFLVFHGEERMDAATRSHLHETPAVVTVPLILLAVPSLLVGWPAIGPLLFGDFFGDAIRVAPEHGALAAVGEKFHGPAGFILHAFGGPAVYLALTGLVVAWYVWLRRPELATRASERLSALYRLLLNKYYADELYQRVFAAGGRGVGTVLWKAGDQAVIDGIMVNGTARAIGRLAAVVRRVQSGYLYHYAFAMVIGLTALLGWLLWAG